MLIEEINTNTIEGRMLMVALSKLIWQDGNTSDYETLNRLYQKAQEQYPEPLPDSSPKITAATIAKMVLDLEGNAEKSARDLQELKATMMVNFGPGKDRDFSGLLDGTETVFGMVVLVCEHLMKKIKERL